MSHNLRYMEGDTVWVTCWNNEVKRKIFNGNGIEVGLYEMSDRMNYHPTHIFPSKRAAKRSIK